jgi:hypothetical protein
LNVRTARPAKNTSGRRKGDTVCVIHKNIRLSPEALDFEANFFLIFF